MGESMAPGWPGIPARWTSAAKCGVGTALGGSAIWFTLSHGILNEVYAPRTDQAAIRDLGLVVTVAGGYFSEERRHASQEVTCPVPGAPYYRVFAILAPAIVHWSADGWRTVHDQETSPTELGVHVADLATGGLAGGSEIGFTFYWPGGERWEGTDFSVRVRQAPAWEGRHRRSIG